MASSYHQLGIMAEERGSYDEALDWYRKSLAIKEELGNRAGMASSYHHFGTVAQQRGSYDEALDWYRKALAILEELGNRAGMASSLSQIGVLLTETGPPEEAVPWNLRSLALRLEIGVPEVRIDFHWLGRQREALGAERFRAILREHLEDEGAASVLPMLDESAGQG
jgi:tetratricopeptide (TPR) repeat protein